MGRNREPSQDEDDDPWVSTLAIAPNLGPESFSLPPDTDELRDAARDLWYSKENFESFGVSRSQNSH